MGAYCRYCDRRCFVTRIHRGRTILAATCPRGMANDRTRMNGADHTTLAHPGPAADVELVERITRCRECGSDRLVWSHGPHKIKPGISEGRLNSGDVVTMFWLGCEECSETIVVWQPDEVVDLLNSLHVCPVKPARPTDSAPTPLAVEHA